MILQAFGNGIDQSSGECALFRVSRNSRMSISSTLGIELMRRRLEQLEPAARRNGHRPEQLTHKATPRRVGMNDRIAGSFDPLRLQPQLLETIDQPLGRTRHVGAMFAFGADARDAQQFNQIALKIGGVRGEIFVEGGHEFAARG